MKVFRNAIEILLVSSILIGCTSFNIVEIEDRSKISTDGFSIFPQYLLSNDRVRLLRYAEKTRSNGDEIASASDTTLFSDLVCYLGNHLYIDLMGNLFFSVGELCNIEDGDYKISNKKWSIVKEGDLVTVSDNNIFTKDRKYRLKDGEIYVEINGSEKKYIEIDTSGYIRNQYSVFGKKVLSEYAKQTTANTVSLYSSELLKVDVTLIDKNNLSIDTVSPLSLKKTITLSRYRDNAIMLSINSGLKIEEFVIEYGINRITLKKSSGEDIMQLDYSDEGVSIVRTIMGSSLMMKMSKKDRETIKYSID